MACFKSFMRALGQYSYERFVLARTMSGQGQYILEQELNIILEHGS